MLRPEILIRRGPGGGPLLEFIGSAVDGRLSCAEVADRRRRRNAPLERGSPPGIEPFAALLTCECPNQVGGEKQLRHNREEESAERDRQRGLKRICSGRGQTYPVHRNKKC